MIDYSFGYETSDGHHGLGVSEGVPPVAFTVRRHDTESPHTCEEIVYRPERTCRRVPGKMHYGERRPKCSECGYGLGDSRWLFCPQCGAKVMS